MALLQMHGFDDLGDDADAQNDPILSPNGGVTFVAGRINGNAMRMNSFADECYIALNAVSNATFYCGFAMRPNSTPSSVQEFAVFMDSAQSGNIYLYINLTNQIQVRRGTSTILGTSTGAISVNAWNYIVLKVFLHDTTGTVELWVNGTKELDLTNQDTLQTANANIGAVRLSCYSSLTALDWDDFYIGDTSGSDMVDQKGDCHIERLDPNGAGTTTNWTPSAGSNWQNVDDGGSPDDDTTYNSTATVTNKDLYACSNIVGNVDTVHAVQVRAYLRKEDAGNRTVNLICRNNVTEVDSGQKGMAVEYTYISHIYENDPDGGGNWTETDVNSMEIGLEVGL